MSQKPGGGGGGRAGGWAGFACSSPSPSSGRCGGGDGAAAAAAIAVAVEWGEPALAFAEPEDNADGFFCCSGLIGRGGGRGTGGEGDEHAAAALTAAAPTAAAAGEAGAVDADEVCIILIDANISASSLWSLEAAAASAVALERATGRRPPLQASCEERQETLRARFICGGAAGGAG